MRLLTAGLLAAGILMTLGCLIRTEHRIDARIEVDVHYINEQADNVLDYIQGDTDTLKGVDKKGQSELMPSLYERAIRFASPIQVAYAQELKNTQSATVQDLAKKLRERFPKIEALKKQGCMGEDNRGYVELFDCDATKDPQKKNEAQKLKAAENEDRKALYNEFARLNSDANITVSAVEQIFARKRLERAKPGEKFQLPEAGSDFQAFKNSPAGKRLGDKCKPGAWVTIK